MGELFSAGVGVFLTGVILGAQMLRFRILERRFGIANPYGWQPAIVLVIIVFGLLLIGLAVLFYEHK